jgi:N-acetylglucosamine kinase-like BadF-type ATPase
MSSTARSDRIVLAVDGGGTKTDLTLIAADGTLLAHTRGGRSQVHYLGIDRTIEVLGELLTHAARSAGIDPQAHPIAATAHLMLAGIDVPEELDALQRGMNAVNWAEQLVIGNDTDALLRSGTERGWGVAVVCGTGINCLGIAPDGREARFLSFGDVSGDWGGGPDVGLAAVAAAVRAADGRGPHTVLEVVLPAHFGLESPLALALEFHRGRLARTRMAELAAIVFSLRDQDQVCAAIVRRLTDEIVAFATAALTRLGLRESDPDVILGGGVSRNVDASVIDQIAAGIHQIAPGAHVSTSSSEPIVGAALFGLDALGADDQARARARASLDAAAVMPATSAGE